MNNDFLNMITILDILIYSVTFPEYNSSYLLSSTNELGRANELISSTIT